VREAQGEDPLVQIVAQHAAQSTRAIASEEGDA
jgi:hypothetical protein